MQSNNLIVLAVLVGMALQPAIVTAQQDKTLTVRSIAEAPSFAKRALVIGVGEYEHAVSLSPTTYKDAGEFAALLQRKFGFPPESVTLLTDAPGSPEKLRPTFIHLKSAISNLLNGVNAKSEVVVYFSGHGTRAADHDWLVPLDGLPSEVEDTCINYDDFKSKLSSKSPARALLIVDACRSLLGGKEAGSSGFGGSKGLAGPQFAELLSCQPREISQIGKKEDFSESVFTHFLLAGLQGAAEAQSNGVVTFDSLKLFVQGKVSQYVSSKFGESQNPDGRASLGAMVLAKPQEGSPIVDNPAANPERPNLNPDAGRRVAAGASKINPKDGAEMVYVPGGEFTMGSNDSDDAKPPHSVRLTRGYWMYRYDVTVGQYEKFCQQTGTQMPDAPDFNPGWRNKDHPIVNVSWSDGIAYSQWAGVTLPTEAQWEHAAKGPRGFKFPWGNTFDAGMLWCSKSEVADAKGTISVGKFPANGYGLYDMAGNVWQWCLDGFDEKFYASRLAEQPDPVNPPTDAQTIRVLRGGSWNLVNSINFSASYRARSAYAVGYTTYGFRCVSRD